MRKSRRKHYAMPAEGWLRKRIKQKYLTTSKIELQDVYLIF